MNLIKVQKIQFITILQGMSEYLEKPFIQFIRTQCRIGWMGMNLSKNYKKKGITSMKGVKLNVLGKEFDVVLPEDCDELIEIFTKDYLFDKFMNYQRGLIISCIVKKLNKQESKEEIQAWLDAYPLGVDRKKEEIRRKAEKKLAAKKESLKQSLTALYPLMPESEINKLVEQISNEAAQQIQK